MVYSPFTVAKAAVKMHQCTEEGCEKTFSRKSNLKAHMRLHTGEEPYQCAQCGKRFKWKSCMASHERVHNRRGPGAYDSEFATDESALWDTAAPDDDHAHPTPYHAEGSANDAYAAQQNRQEAQFKKLGLHPAAGLGAHPQESHAAAQADALAEVHALQLRQQLHEQMQKMELQQKQQLQFHEGQQQQAQELYLRQQRLEQEQHEQQEQHKQQEQHEQQRQQEQQRQDSRRPHLPSFHPSRISRRKKSHPAVVQPDSNQQSGKQQQLPLYYRLGGRLSGSLRPQSVDMADVSADMSDDATVGENLSSPSKTEFYSPSVGLPSSFLQRPGAPADYKADMDFKSEPTMSATFPNSTPLSDSVPPSGSSGVLPFDVSDDGQLQEYFFCRKPVSGEMGQPYFTQEPGAALHRISGERPPGCLSGNMSDMFSSSRLSGLLSGGVSPLAATLATPGLSPRTTGFGGAFGLSSPGESFSMGFDSGSGRASGS